MKTKSIFATILILFSLSIFAQLKVDQYGRIGMGTLFPNPAYKCHVAGNLLCSSYPASPFYELQIKVGNGWPGCEIGATSDILAFWSDNTIGYHELRASDFMKMSDSTMKTNVIHIENSLDRMMKIRLVFYSIEDNKIDGLTGEKILKNKFEYGFLSQQIRDLFPEVNITSTDQNGLVLLDYDQLIPIAVAAIQSQQNRIDSLAKEIKNFQTRIDHNISERINSSYFDHTENQNILNQNMPNPFDQKTEIKYTIVDKNFRKATILLFDMSGLLMKEYDIPKAGQSSIVINANEFKPGMYIYTLLVNQIEIDTKRMILLN